MISASVGQGGQNRESDVAIIRNLLVRHRQWALIDVRQKRGVDAEFIAAIRNFQTGACALATGDGRVDPNGFTYRRLSLRNIPRPGHRVLQASCWNPGPDLTLADYRRAATALNCETAAIQAVAEVETRRAPHDEQGRPTILYERHKFRLFTNGAYNATHPDLSGPQGNYGRFSAQYSKLKRAAVLNEEAALKSCSWGAFQIMGFNHTAAGYATAAALVNAMIGSQAAQLNAFVSFIRADANLLSAIRARNWARFARGYNGPDYEANDYDTKMATAYARFAAQNAPRSNEN